MTVEQKNRMLESLAWLRARFITELGEFTYIDAAGPLTKKTRDEIAQLDAMTEEIQQERPVPASIDDRPAHAAACSDAGIPAGTQRTQE